MVCDFAFVPLPTCSNIRYSHIWTNTFRWGALQFTPPPKRWRRQMWCKQQWTGPFCLMVCHLQEIETKLWNAIVSTDVNVSEKAQMRANKPKTHLCARNFTLLLRTSVIWCRFWSSAFSSLSTFFFCSSSSLITRRRKLFCFFQRIRPLCVE